MTERHSQVATEAIILDDGGKQRHSQVVPEAVLLSYAGAQRHSQVAGEVVVINYDGVQRHSQVVPEVVVIAYDGGQRHSQIVPEAILLGFGFARPTHEHVQYAMQQASSVQATQEWVEYALHQESAVRETDLYFQYGMHQESAVSVTHLYVQVALRPSPNRPDILPQLRGICNMRNVIRAGEEESGIAASSGTWQAVAKEVFGYRRQLLQRLHMRYMDAEDASNYVDIPQGETGDQTIFLADMLSREQFEARVLDSDPEEWVAIRPVESVDRAANTRPAFLLRDTAVVLLHYEEDWDGVYDRLRMRGVDSPLDDEDWDDDTLVPNELLGPLFCTCLKLEAARILCLREPVLGGMARSAYILRERLRVEKDLFNQGASMNRHLATRAAPFPHRPE